MKHNIENVQQKQKAYYDRKHGAGACYQVGALVKMKDFNRKKEKRWLPRFSMEGSLHNYGLTWKDCIA